MELLLVKAAMHRNVSEETESQATNEGAVSYRQLQTKRLKPFIGKNFTNENLPLLLYFDCGAILKQYLGANYYNGRPNHNLKIFLQLSFSICRILGWWKCMLRDKYS